MLNFAGYRNEYLLDYLESVAQGLNRLPEKPCKERLGSIIGQLMDRRMFGQFSRPFSLG
jgi:hypothetical protein